MSAPEKRRGGSSGHILRTASPHTHRHGTPGAGGSSSSSNNNHNTTGTSSSPASMLPTVPPKAAMPNAMSTSSPEDTHDGGGNGGGGALPPERKDKDKDREKDSAGAASGMSRSNSRQHKDRDRDAAALAGMLREKDERIAYLEEDMAVMEREFQRELDKLSQAESETATFWQAKHSALNQQFLRTDTELRLARTELELREREREDLRGGWEVLRRELAERDDEVRGLRGQVRGLKEFVSTSTRVDDQASDEIFGGGMTRLGNGLQNWVIVNFRKTRIDLARLDEVTLAEVGDLVPMYEELVRAAKVHLLQSLVSRVLVDTVFAAYYPGLSEEQTQQFRQMEALLSSFIKSDETTNQWRSSTLTLLRREAPDSLQAETSIFAEKVMDRINRLLDALTDGTRSPARDSGLRVLVNNSIELARLLVVQKAVLRIHMPVILPHQRVTFEADTMEDIGGEDEDALEHREICCVVFPGMIKHGDENGGHMQYRNVIAKARVLCSPEE
ncbi:hypothetical protein B0I35DRAFT_481602 [Stachybotrys elegans]|uniref:Uncharacterized protein n=1 Tax=Stachybotrys elegans TaxID=80388 RepID=A0A8K0SPU1_9HYPO|nr:hypothetical protein B0I35DRAFT_481602 [Stachybotrys elegans]